MQRILCLSPGKRNCVNMKRLWVFWFSIMFSLLTPAIATRRCFFSWGDVQNVSKWKDTGVLKDLDLSLFQILILWIFLIISQIFRCGALILLFSVMDYGALLAILLLFVNNIIQLFGALYGKF